MLGILASLCLISATLVTSNPLDNTSNIEDEGRNVAIGPVVTVPSIDLPNYLGRWYQMYDNLYVRANVGNSRNNQCVTADYGLNLNGSISVINNSRLGGPDSDKLSSITGYAFIPDPAEPGKILVDFPTPGPPGEYYIIMLGPKEDTFPSTPLYQYAVITNSMRESLFILGRDPNNFARFEDEILEFVEQNGFDRLINRPLPSVQNSECKYNYQ